MFRSRLFGSTFHARATDGEWRAGVTLWMKSWDQVPAGSLPTDDIDLCRLAELARDIKTWKKVKDGALRGWVLCTDGRLYHPVVAEGINNAIDHKAKQRAKTAKARVAALEKHLKDAKTDDERARITEEIRRIQQTVSQGLSQTLKQGPREEKEKGREGNNSSDPDGSGATAPDVPVEPIDVIFGLGIPLLVQANVPEKNARSFLGLQRRLAKDDAKVADAIRACIETKALQPIEFIAGCIKPGATGKHSGFENLDYHAGVNEDGSF